MIGVTIVTVIFWNIFYEIKYLSQHADSESTTLYWKKNHIVFIYNVHDIVSKKTGSKL